MISDAEVSARTEKYAKGIPQSCHRNNNWFCRRDDNVKLQMVMEIK